MLKQLDRRDYPGKTRYPERIVQFGGGNFLRGFADWVVDLLNDETVFAGGVALVKATPGDYADLDAQGCLYTTCLLGIYAGELVEQTRLIGAINRTVYPYQDFAAYLALARQPEVRFIFSNTTESGIVFSADDNFDDQPPGSFPAKLTRFLYERYRHFDGAAEAGCIIIPTELIVDNATRLREIMLECSARWLLEAGFADWIARHNLFCNTLVDRIVSGFPRARAAALFERLGYEDRLLTMGEIYHSWIIEAPPSLLEEFPVDKTRTPLNVKVVDDAAPYRTIKVRLLNGAHTAMVPLGILLGIESVREVMEHAELAPFVQDLITHEVIPSVTEVPRAELEDFASDVFDRFRNPHIHHRLLTIALNSSTKVTERILPSLLGYLEQTGELPPRLTVALAAFIRLYCGEWRGEAIALNDDPDVLAWFREQWETAPSSDALARAALGNQALWQRDLTQVSGLVERVSDALDAIEQGRLSDLLGSAGA
ncbi:MAG: tagaturonate reductase [Chloroflexi bacterium]|nr:tagaturonate reductase [Chloroflexota bacterium]